MPRGFRGNVNHIATAIQLYTSATQPLRADELVRASYYYDPQELRDQSDGFTSAPAKRPAFSMRYIRACKKFALEQGADPSRWREAFEWHRFAVLLRKNRGLTSAMQPLVRTQYSIGTHHWAGSARGRRAAATAAAQAAVHGTGMAITSQATSAISPSSATSAGSSSATTTAQATNRRSGRQSTTATVPGLTTTDAAADYLLTLRPRNPAITNRIPDEDRATLLRHQVNIRKRSRLVDVEDLAEMLYFDADAEHTASEQVAQREAWVEEVRGMYQHRELCELVCWIIDEFLEIELDGGLTYEEMLTANLRDIHGVMERAKRALEKRVRKWKCERGLHWASEETMCDQE